MRDALSSFPEDKGGFFRFLWFYEAQEGTFFVDFWTLEDA